MFGFLKKKKADTPLFLYNTLTKQKDTFQALSGRKVTMYTCGPTVYDYAHIGNLRAYVFADIVRRVLEYSGLSVKQIVNITDVGHLVNDGDEGEDKMTSALLREGKELTLATMQELGQYYAESFIEDLKALNIQMPFAFPRASEHVPEQIAFISALMQKGYAYTASDGVYFDTAKFSAYGALGLPSDVEDAAGEHSRIGAHREKHDQRDFALWKFNPTLGFEAPWGKGFPGWHIECTAMATKYLGKSIDIHTGGIDHIAVHHNNEIAQAEAVSGKRFVHYWMHGSFITIEGKRIGKSEGNAIRLHQLRERDVSPSAYRYLLLTAHYRSLMNFTWDAVIAAKTALQRAQRIFADMQKGGSVVETYRVRFEQAIYDDLDTPKAIALLWELLKDDAVLPKDKRATILVFDKVFGLGFGKNREVGEKISVVTPLDMTPEISVLLDEREQARSVQNWTRADEIRIIFEKQGFTVEDTPEGAVVRKIPSGL